MVRHGHGISVEVVGSMLEMADMAWHAFEHRCERGVGAHDDHEAARLRDENHRLRTILSDNLALLQTIYNSPEVSLDCPPDVSSCSPTLRIHKDGMFVAVIDSSRRKVCLSSIVVPRLAQLEVGLGIRNQSRGIASRFILLGKCSNRCFISLGHLR